jgi:deazaflavin-dependent oxidoreductase (nitroreductase family)
VLARLTPPRAVLIPLWVLHRAVYRMTAGRIGRRMAGTPALLLTTVGRLSGRPRQVSLYYMEDGQNIVVVASNAGSDRDPDWWRNLQASPDAVVWLGSLRRRVRARRASPQELERIWPRLLAMYPGYETYRQRIARELPVVVLEPRP